MPKDGFRSITIHENIYELIQHRVKRKKLQGINTSITAEAEAFLRLCR